MAPQAVTFHLAEAESAEQAVKSFVVGDQGEIIGNILKFPGFQAVATVRKTTGVYTLQVAPASATHVPVN